MESHTPNRFKTRRFNLGYRICLGALIFSWAFVLESLGPHYLDMMLLHSPHQHLDLVRWTYENFFSPISENRTKLPIGETTWNDQPTWSGLLHLWSQLLVWPLPSGQNYLSGLRPGFVGDTASPSLGDLDTWELSNCPQHSFSRRWYPRAERLKWMHATCVLIKKTSPSDGGWFWCVWSVDITAASHRSSDHCSSAAQDRTKKRGSCIGYIGERRQSHMIGSGMMECSQASYYTDIFYVSGCANGWGNGGREPLLVHLLWPKAQLLCRHSYNWLFHVFLQ